MTLLSILRRNSKLCHIFKTFTSERSKLCLASYHLKSQLPDLLIFSSLISFGHYLFNTCYFSPTDLMNHFACVKVTTVLTESVLVFRTRGDQPNQKELERRGFEVRHNDDHLRLKEKYQNAAFYVNQKLINHFYLTCGFF